MAKVGDRIGAILSGTKEKVLFLGFGIYTGDHPVPTEILGVDACIKNPRLELDNGEVVYGFECWWGDELTVKEKLKKYNAVENVLMSEVRK